MNIFSLHDAFTYKLESFNSGPSGIAKWLLDTHAALRSSAHKRFNKFVAVVIPMSLVSEPPSDVLRLPRLGNTEKLVSKPLNARQSEMTSGNVNASPLAPSNSTGYSPFKICHFCCKGFGSLSLAIHQRTCKQRCTEYDVSLEKSIRDTCRPARQSTRTQRHQVVHKNEPPHPGELPTSASSSAKSRRRLVPIRDSGPVLEPRAPRPKTAVKSHSSLLASGHEVPVICNEQCTATEHGVVCSTCGECVPSFKYHVHRRTCCSSKNYVSAGDIVFPRTRQTSTDQLQPVAKKAITCVTCSICGRKYGTKSIAIHEPQCIRKRQLENRRLPVGERRPIPATTRNPLRQVEDKKICPRTDTDIAEAYFQYCYAEFEKELLPCDKCGRSFAPERHKKHVLNCNAKPLR